MEQLQRQQQARLEMEHKERRLREAHIMYAQQVAAQQAILAAARASGAGFMSGGQLSLVSNQSSVDSEHEDEEERGRDSDDDDDDEMMEGDEGSEEDGPPSGLEFLRKQTLALQQGAAHLPGRPDASLSDPGKRAPSPAVRVKQEPEDDLSPVGRPSASSPDGQVDWSYDEHFKAVRELVISSVMFFSLSLRKNEKIKPASD